MSSFIAENTIIASSYKNNSLPLEEEGDRKLVLLTHDGDEYYIRILEFTDQDEWDVKISLQLPQNSCGDVPSPNGYIFSLAFFDDLGGSTERFYVFLGYGPEPGETGENAIWYFVFDLDNSDYRYRHCGEFDNILAENGFATEYFRQLTLAPEESEGICRLVVGYRREFGTLPDTTWKSGFHAGYLTQLPLNRLSFSLDYTKMPLEIDTNPKHAPQPIQYMGIIDRNSYCDLVILIAGPIGPDDDVLFVHKLGSVTNPLRASWGTTCGPLQDHPWYFAKIQITENSSTHANIAIVRDVEGASGSSFVRYTSEPNVDEFQNWKMVLEASPLEPNIPAECRLFHMDSGDMNNDLHNDDDLVVIWKECEGCSEDYYVLKITSVSPGDPEECEDIDFAHSFVTEFENDEEHIDDLSEPMYIRYTAKEGGYFLSLFYHDTSDGISVHVEEYDF